MEGYAIVICSSLFFTLHIRLVLKVEIRQLEPGEGYSYFELRLFKPGKILLKQGLFVNVNIICFVDPGIEITFLQ